MEVSSTIKSSEVTEDIGYKSVSRGAVFAFILALCSPLSFYTPAVLFLPLAGVFFAVSALVSFRRYPDELTGRPLAYAGFALAGITLIAAPIQHAYIYATEVPEGYERISFGDLKSPLGSPDRPTKAALALDGKKVFLRGYVHLASCSSSSVKNFILVPDLATCCFGKQPPLTHMIEVNLGGDLLIEPSMRKLRLAGTLYVDSQLKQLSSVQGVYYQMRVDHLR
jgi:hypothetical protein